MAYLTCDHCNQTNEVKSSYLTFCNHCGKKLHNNFNDWIKEHPGKSFEDYKSLVCRKSIIHWEPESKQIQKQRISPLKILIALSAVAIISVGVYFTFMHEYNPTSNIQQWASKNISFNTSNVDEWTSITTQEGNFQINFPSKPDKITEQTETAAGIFQNITYQFVPESEEDENLSYSISYIAYPPDMINSRLINTNQISDFFNYTFDGMLKNEGGVLKSKNEIVYGLYPGREIRAGIHNGLAELKCRVYLVENTLYTLKIKSLNQNAGNAAGEEFLNSFKLLAYAQTLSQH